MKKATNAVKKVLIIDDEESILDTLQIVLEAEGFGVVLHATPPTVKQIIKINPNIIFLDLILKGTNGKDICIKLKGNDKAKEIPVILLSANSEQMLKEAANACGADGFLTKPFDIAVLAAVVKKYTR